MVDWFTYAILGALLLLFFAFYLIARRTVQGFKEGLDDSRRNR